jgi:drug/metabolite transporter (DMT)-like permease
LSFDPLVLGLGAAFCWGTADFLSRRQSERIGSYRTALFAQAVTLAMLFAAFPFFHANISFGPWQAAVLVGAGALNFVAFIMLYRAFHRGVVSVVAPVAYTYPAVTAVLSIAILAAPVGLRQGAAIAGVIAGVMLLSSRFSEIRGYAAGSGAPGLTAGIAPAAGSSVSFGVVYVGMGYAAPTVGYFLPAVFLRGIGVVTGLALAPILKQDVSPSRAVLSKVMLTMGVLETIGLLSFTYGISQGGAALPVVAALSGMGGAVAAGYGIAFLRERLEWNQLVGILLSMAGVFALLLLGV